MAAPTLGAFLQRLKHAMSAETLAACSDQELVERFRSGRDDAVFRSILDRHGPMVFHVCRRVLSSAADVEDAFQATFLILIRRGHTVRRHSSLASWLHGVAWRTAMKLRSQSDRRRRREARSARTESSPVTNATTWGEVRGILDDELRRLPESLRTALVLCYLEGRTQDEAAAQLGVSKSTLRRNLDRGRERLAQRLARRGVTVGAILGAGLLSECAHGAGVSRALLLRTISSASHTAANLAAPATVLPARVAALTDGVIKTMYYGKYKSIVAVLACSVAFGLGMMQIRPELASAQDKAASAKPAVTAPDIEPIDADLVFRDWVQKQLRLSPNQIRQLTEAHEKGTESLPEQTKRVSELDDRIKKLQEEIERLDQERGAAQKLIHQARTDHVKAAISKVLSRDAVEQLRQMTIQRMRLSDVLLDAKVRARLDLNDEQVKKIQEIKQKDAFWVYEQVPTTTHLYTTRVLIRDTANARLVVSDLSEGSRTELLKVLTPQQRQTLERLSGMTFDKSK